VHDLADSETNGLGANNALRIVVVDDEPLICELVAELLRYSGIEVVIATNPALGSQLISGIEFDLAIIDILMPGASGFVLAKLAANKSTPVLLMTGHPDQTSKISKLGFPLIGKPFALAKLTNAVTNELTHRAENLNRVRLGFAAMGDTANIQADGLRLLGQVDGA
jgi:two-component system response regulator VanR